MLDKMKDSLHKSQEYLEDLVDKLDDQLEDMAEEAGEVWQQTRPKLQALKASLSEAAQSLHTQTDEARLQAHLAAMDAADQWQHLDETVTELAKHAHSKGEYKLQHANLQAHLAAMDARDFSAEKSEEIRQDFKQGRDKLERASHEAVASIERSFELIGNSYIGPYM